MLIFREELERENDPEAVRQNLVAGVYDQRRIEIATEYLDSVKRQEPRDKTAISDTREEQALASAEEALAVAKQAHRIAEQNLAAAKVSAATSSKKTR